MIADSVICLVICLWERNISGDLERNEMLIFLMGLRFDVIPREFLQGRRSKGF